MENAIQLVARYQTWVYAALALVALIYLRSWWRAQRSLRQVQFGLERETVVTQRNRAILMLLIFGTIGLSVFVISAIILPNLDYLTPPTATPRASVTPLPSATPVRSLITPGPGTVVPTLVVDSDGCNNPHATLSQPQPYDRIVGTYEVHGTADVNNFAFYKFEISGDNTGGAWVPLGVGTAPVTDGTLGTFDAAAYQPGQYAFRLVVLDTSGNAPTPCVIVVTFEAPPVSLLTPQP